MISPFIHCGIRERNTSQIVLVAKTIALKNIVKTLLLECSLHAQL